MDCTETIYIDSAQSLIERVERINTIIFSLETRMVEVGAGNSTTEEYTIDDGQTKINTIYRSPESIARAISLYEKLKQKALNNLNGRGMVLRPARGLL